MIDAAIQARHFTKDVIDRSYKSTEERICFYTKELNRAYERKRDLDNTKGKKIYMCKFGREEFWLDAKIVKRNIDYAIQFWESALKEEKANG